MTKTGDFLKKAFVTTMAFGTIFVYSKLANAEELDYNDCKARGNVYSCAGWGTPEEENGNLGLLDYFRSNVIGNSDWSNKGDYFNGTINGEKVKFIKCGKYRVIVRVYGDENSKEGELKRIMKGINDSGETMVAKKNGLETKIIQDSSKVSAGTVASLGANDGDYKKLARKTIAGSALAENYLGN
jgi:hypothetical protein